MLLPWATARVVSSLPARAISNGDVLYMVRSSPLNMQVYLTWIALYKWQHWDVAVNFIAIWHSCEFRVFRPFRGCIFQFPYLFNQPSKSHDFICAEIVSSTLFRPILFIGWKLVFEVLSVGSAISTTVYLLSTKHHHAKDPSAPSQNFIPPSYLWISNFAFCDFCPAMSSDTV